MKIGFIFSGQGAQYHGMGKDLYEKFPTVRKHFDLAEEIMQEPLKNIMFSEDERLHLTLYAQPSIFTLSTAIRDLLSNYNIVSSASAGLSLGEYSAYYDAGVFDFESGLRTIIHRAYFMHKNTESHPGAMVALLGDKTNLQRLIEDIDGCYIANLNSPTQTVVGGQKESMEKVVSDFKNYGFRRATMLKTSGAFHTPLMKTARKEFYDYIKYTQKEPPNKPLYLNTTGKKYTDEDLNDVMSTQMVSPVKFEAMIESMMNDGIEVFIEVGPQDTLKRLIKKQARDCHVYHIENIETLEATLQALKELNNEILK